MKIRLDVILDLVGAEGKEVENVMCDIIDKMWNYAADVDIIREEEVD